MANSVNKVILVGNVGSEPEIRSTQIGSEIASFSMATSERWKDKSSGEMKEKTEWTRIVVFAPGVVNLVKEYVHKGSKLYIEGKIQTREYQDAQGTKKYSTEVVLNQYSSQLVLLDSRRENRTPVDVSGFEASKEPSSTDLDDEIPF
jgi:single-strand DNA-binding protein